MSISVKFKETDGKSTCYGCEACASICPRNAIRMEEDNEGFRYPEIDAKLCIECGICDRVCPWDNVPDYNEDEQIAFGGYINDRKILESSTSGGAFSAIAEMWCKKNYVIFGAESEGLDVYHSYITDKSELYRFRKSKYAQSIIGNSYKNAYRFLQEGKNVLFSGTPCQIAGLLNYIGGKKYKGDLLTVEVVCEGVPSPLYIRKMDNMYFWKTGNGIQSIDYRYKDGNKWDFEVMSITSKSRKRLFKCDRWFNPFWKLWLDHLMSRPSCYRCKFAGSKRIADITLGDLWGVHLYCPDLYGNNRGCSLVVFNSDKGRLLFHGIGNQMYGRRLDFNTALKYQSPMRKPISMNTRRSEFMADLRDRETGYRELIRKWYSGPSMKLLLQKYIWGNRQKVFVWNLINGKNRILK